MSLRHIPAHFLVVALCLGTSVTLVAGDTRVAAADHRQPTRSAGDHSFTQPPGQAKWEWDGYARVRKDRTGQIVEVRDSAVVYASADRTTANYACYNAFRYGAVERARDGIRDEVLECRVNVRGPLP